MALLDEIYAYTARTKMSPTRFGRQSVNDPRFVTDLRNGRTVRDSTQQRVRDFMANNPTPPAP